MGIWIQNCRTPPGCECCQPREFIAENLQNYEDWKKDGNDWGGSDWKSKACCSIQFELSQIFCPGREAILMAAEAVLRVETAD